MYELYCRAGRKGNDDITVYVPSELFNEISDIIWDYDETRFPLSDNVKKKYWDYGFSCCRSSYYKEVEMKSVSEINVQFEVNEYEALDNFFVSTAEENAYMAEQAALGAKEIFYYYTYNDDEVDGTIIWPEAPEGMEWVIVENEIVTDTWSRMTDKYILTLRLQCVEIEK